MIEKNNIQKNNVALYRPYGISGQIHSPKLNLQCSNLFVVETMLKKKEERKEKRQETKKNEWQGSGNSRRRKRNDFSSTLLRYIDKYERNDFKTPSQNKREAVYCASKQQIWTET